MSPDTEGRDENSSLSPRDDGSDEHSTGATQAAFEAALEKVDSIIAARLREVERKHAIIKSAFLEGGHAYLAELREQISALSAPVPEQALARLTSAAQQQARDLLIDIVAAEMRGVAHPRRDMQPILTAFLAALKQVAAVAAEEQVRSERSERANTAPALQAEVERLREVNADLLEALTHMARVIDDGGQPHPMGPAMLKVRAAINRSTEV